MFALYHSKILPKTETNSLANLPTKTQPYKNIFHAFFAVFKAFFTLPHIKTLIIFLLLYNAAEAQLMRIVPLFLLDKTTNSGLGLTTIQIGLIYGLCGGIAITIGAILAGWIIGKTALKQSLIPITCLASIANCGYILLPYLINYWPHHNAYLATTVIIFGQFCFGLATSTYMVFIMKICEHEKYKTTFYAIGTALMSLGIMFFGAISGIMQQLLTYTGFFLWIIFLSSVIMLYTLYTAKKLLQTKH
jgi:MFS transporter, PAT family, beta-lactamase induction signal transducer AmpG